MTTLNNWRGYLDANPDLGAAGIVDEAGAQRHYSGWGAAEGRVNTPAAPAAAPAPAAPAWNRYAVAGTNANLPADYSAAQNLIAGNASNPNLDPNSRFNTGNFGGGRHLTVQQIRDFAATNPTNEQILEQAAAYGMNQEQLARALVYGRGDTLNDLTTNQMVNDSSNYGYTSEGLITALNGRSKSAQNGNSALTVNGGGSGGGSGGSGGGGSSSGSSGGIVASAMSPNSATVQNWNVTAPQTVNQQAANIVAQDSPLMQQARARAMMAANERGLVNSSMAVGDAQSAVLDRAIEIGSRDASTNAQAAQFNANAANQNSMFNVGQNNQWGTNALDRRERALDREQSASERAKDRAAAIAAAGFDAQTRRELAALEQTYRTQLNSDQGFDRQFSQYTESLLRIDAIEGLDAPAKAAMKAEALRALQSYATVRNLNLDLNFGTQPTTPLTQTEIAAAAAQRLREIAAAQGLISQSGGFQGAGVGTGADGSASGGVGGLGIGDGGTGGSGD